MSPDRNGPTTKLSVFLRGPYSEKKPVKGHKPSTRLELKQNFIGIAAYVTLFTASEMCVHFVNDNF